MKITDAPVAAELMSSAVHYVDADMHLDEIVTFLLQHHLKSVPVISTEDGKRRLLGFITDADCLEHLSNELFYGSPSPIQTARTIMQRHPVCASPDTDVFTLTSVFISHKQLQLPVVEGPYFVGLVDRLDVLRAVDRYYQKWVRSNTQERFPVDVHEIMNHRFINQR